MVFREAVGLDAFVAEFGAGLSKCQAGDVAVVVFGGVSDKGSPAATNVEQSVGMTLVRTL